jgi:Uma2 family endonuclease
MANLYRFTVDEYHRLIEVGILPEGAPIELLVGLLVRKMSRNPPHDQTVRRLTRLMFARVPQPAWVISPQCAITTPDSVPEPDLVIACGPEQLYDNAHPSAAEIALLVEVSDSSLAEDRGLKLRVYAAAGIVLYWIVNIPDARVEVYTQPTGSGDQATYAQVQHFGPAADLVLILGGVALAPIRVSDILP